MTKHKTPFELTAVLNIYMMWVALLPLATIGVWIVNNNFEHLPKIMSYSALGFMAILLARKKFILNDWFLVFLLLWSIFIIINGALRNPINSPFFSHLSTLIMHIIPISFGYMCQKYYNAEALIEEKGLFAGVILSGIFILYLLLNTFGYIPYLGVSSLIAFPILLAFTKKKFGLMALFTMAAILSGKRTVLLGLMFVIFIHYFSKGGRGFFNLLLGGIFMVFLTILATDFYEVSLFRRFDAIFEITDFESLDLALSGRGTDVMSAINSINDNKWNWIFGKGAGATFSVEYSHLQDLWITHYTHISPISYIFLGGSIFALIVYWRLFSILIFSLRNTDKFLPLIFIYYLITSFTGATLFSDPFLWMVAGIMICRRRQII